jgi:uncharacterized membrane protein
MRIRVSLFYFYLSLSRVSAFLAQVKQSSPTLQDSRRLSVSRTSFTPAIPRAKASQQSEQQPKSSSRCAQLRDSLNADGDGTLSTSTWNPRLRWTLGTIAGLGTLETAYLTWTKLSGLEPSLCGTSGDCGSVLNGPYSFLPGTGIPLATLGLLAYATVAYLAIGPILGKDDGNSDENNRVALVAITTAMGVFSVFLMTILFGVLKETCPYCIASAIFSISLAKLSWLGGVLPKERARDGIVATSGMSLAAFAAAVTLYVGSSSALDSSFTGSSDVIALQQQQQQQQQGPSQTLLAQGQAPPSISTTSTSRALAIANQLQALDAHFYGAYWCSHCYDQKEELGREAMAKIPYIECSKEGLNAQTQLCKEKKIPGYPTWEINGKLFPGEQALDELEDIIKQVTSK